MMPRSKIELAQIKKISLAARRPNREARAKRIYRARYRAQLSIKEVSEACGVSRNTYAKAESGESEPKVCLLEAIALVCGVDFGWLVAGGNEQIVMAKDLSNVGKIK